MRHSYLQKRRSVLAAVQRHPQWGNRLLLRGGHHVQIHDLESPSCDASCQVDQGAPSEFPIGLCDGCGVLNPILQSCSRERQLFRKPKAS